MRIHPVTGQIAHGIAGDGVYVDGVQIAPGGGQSGMPDWMGDQVLYCAGDGLVLAKPDGSARTQIAAPSSFVRASVAGWASWSPERGVVTSWGLRLPAAVLLDMAPDGTLLVGDGYQTGQGLSAYRTGSLTPLWTAPAARPEMRFPYSQAAILDAQTAIWTENVNGRMVLKGYFSGMFPMGPRPPWNVLHGRPRRINGDVWVVYLRAEDDAVIAHPWDYVGLGFCVQDSGNHYGPDAWSDGATVTLCWSNGAGEVAGDIRRQPFRLTELQDIPSVSLPPVVVPRPLAPKGPVTFAGVFGADDTTPGNVAIWAKGPRAVPAAPMPSTLAIVTEIELVDQVPADRLAGIYCDRIQDTTKGIDISLEKRIELSRPVAERLRVPLWIYFDGRICPLDDIERWCGSTPAIIIQQFYIEAYGHEGETVETYAAEIAAAADILRESGWSWIPAIRFTTGGGRIPIAKVGDALNRTTGVLAGSLGHVLFAGPGRADSIMNLPEAAAYVDAWLGIETAVEPSKAREWADALFPAPPVVTPPKPPVPPPVPPMTDDPLLQLGDEARASAILIAYRTLLNRDPDPIGVGIYAERLKSGWTVEQMEADIKESPEYKALHPAPIPIPPGGARPDMHAWPKFGASYATGLTNPACDPALFAALNRDAGGNYTRLWALDAWAVGPNGSGQYAGFMPWLRDAAGVFDLNAPNPAYDERLNAYVRIQNGAGATCHITVLELYTWSERKQGLLWVPDQNLGPFRRNKNGVRWGDPDDPTFETLPDDVLDAFIARICTAVKGLAVAFECGNEMPEKDMHARIAASLRSHFTPDWQPEITVNRQEDTPGQYQNMRIGTNYDRIAYHGKDSLAYLDEDFDREPVHRTFRSMWTDQAIEPKRIIFSSDGCRARADSVENAYDWPTLKEVLQDHWRRGCSLEHLSRVKMRPFLEGRLDLRADFEGDWLRSIRG